MATNRVIPPERYRALNVTREFGASGEVELWHDDQLDRTVAIKWLSSHEGEEQFLNEYRLIASSRSRYVVEIYDLIFDRHGVLVGIVLEFIDGLDLRSLVSLAGSTDLVNRYKVLYQVASGLADLHALPVIHRDIKPANIVQASDGRVKIVDFGLSEPAFSVSTQRVRGTFGYTPPEAFGTRPVVLTTSSDVYALGRVCWKLLVGDHADVGESGIPNRSRFPLPSIASRIQIPSPLAQVIDQCLCWNASDRTSAAAVATAFCREITNGKHSATVVLSGGIHELNVNRPRATVSSTYGKIHVAYDGYDFKVAATEGEAFINAKTAQPGDILSEGCLLMFGNQSRGMSRSYAPFRMFSPELVF